jgi:aminopeptidase N
MVVRLVGNDQIREPWLDEGLANWGAYKYLAQQGQDISSLGKNSPNTDLGRELSQMYSRQDYYLTAYTGGESFWFGLEKELGEEKVKQVLRRYLANYRFEMATTDDLLEAIRQEAHRDMEDYFNQWFASGSD